MRLALIPLKNMEMPFKGLPPHVCVAAPRSMGRARGRHGRTGPA